MSHSVLFRVFLVLVDFNLSFQAFRRKGQEQTPSAIIAALDALGTVLRDDLDASGSPFAAGDNPSIPAGYTYLGQFIDHDLSLEPTSLPQAELTRRATE